jgi:hypothetical protein
MIQIRRPPPHSQARVNAESPQSRLVKQSDFKASRHAGIALPAGDDRKFSAANL